MFLSNWLVFKIVLAAVTGLVDYPLAADVLLKYDNANKLYLDGNSIDYVSNVVLYKGETSYEIEGPNVIVGDEQKITASDATSSDQFGGSVSISGDYAIIGAVGDDDNSASNSGSVYIFKRSGTSWSLQQKLTAGSDAAANDHFGISVSISGNYAIIGSWRDDDGGSNSGSAYIFIREGTSWSLQEKLTASDAAVDDEFGISVSIDGDYAIVGAYGDDDGGSYSGSAYIFKRNGTSWSQQKITAGTDAAVDDEFGRSVSISGEYAIIGAYRNNSITGAAYIFKRDGNTWTKQQKLTASDGVASDRFGWSVDIDGDYAIVGASQGDSTVTDSGAVYIFKRNGTTWSQQAKLTASDAATSDNFGWSVSITGDYAIVGASYDHHSGISDAGSVYVFKRSGTSWLEINRITASDAAASDYFGNSVAISRDHVIIGAYNENSVAGAAYIYPLKEVTNYYITQPGTYRADLQICGIDYKTNEVEVTGGVTPTKSWKSNEDQILYASDGTANNNFGSSCAMWGSYMVVGSFEGSSNTQGAIYIYKKESGSWTFKQKISGEGANDYFSGYGAVDIHEDTIIVGAYKHGTNDNTGKAYIYTRSGETWSLESSIVSDDLATDDKFGISVSVHGDYAVVGAQLEDGPTNSGAGYIFHRSNGTWTQQTKLNPGADDENVGTHVSIYGDYVVLSGKRSGSDFRGRAHVYKRTGTSWGDHTVISNPNPGNSDFFSERLSITDGYMAIGSDADDPGGTTDAGQVYVFKHSGTNDWTLEATLEASDKTSSMRFASGISMTPNVLIVGAHQEGTGGANAGAVYIYERSGTSWTEVKKVVASDAASGDRLGYYVGVNNDGLSFVAGAYGESTKGASAGAAYIFEKADIASLTFDGYNQLSLTNTPTYTSSKLAYYSNVYDVGTLTDKLYIENPGDYTSLTFDTSSNVAYFSNAMVGAIASTTASYGKQDQVLTADQDAGYSNGDASQGGYGNSIDMSADGTRMVVGNAHYTDSNGRVWLYHLENGLWVLKQTWDGGTRLGSQVAMNEAGTRAFALYTGGGVKIWDYSSGAWDTSDSGTYAIAPGAINGEAPAVDCNKTGDVVIIGAGNSNNTWIYRLSGGSWSSEKNFSRKGSGVSMNGAGTRCFMGDRSSHKVWESNYSSGSWGTETEIIEDTSVSSSYWPASLSTDSAGETLCILNNASGEGAIYERASNGSWSASVSGILSKTEVYGSDKAGISYDGTMALFGHHSNSGALSTGGHALLYTKSGSTWSITQTLLNPSSSQHSDDYFGGGIGLAKTAKDRFVVAAIGDDNAGTNYGAIYTYTNAIPKYLDFDTYNKLSIENITPTSTTLKYGSNTYDLGTVTDVYIAYPGTYEAAITASDKFALVSNVVSGSIIEKPYNATSIVSWTNLGTTLTSDTNNITFSGYVDWDTTGTVSTSFDSTNNAIVFGGGNVGLQADFTSLRPDRNSNLWVEYEVYLTSGDMRSMLGIGKADGSNSDWFNWYDYRVYVRDANVGTGTSGNVPTGQWVKLAWKSDYIGSGDRRVSALLDSGSGYQEIAYHTGAPMNAGSNYLDDTGVLSYIRLFYTSGNAGASTIGNKIRNIHIFNDQSDVPTAPPSLTHDTYNKLSIENITPTSTSLRLGSNTYDLGTATDIYIANDGTYEIETKDANTFALVSNEVSQIKLPDVVTVDWNTTSLSSITASNGDTLTTNVGGTWDVQTDSTMGKMVHIQTATTSRKFEIENSTQSLTSFVGTGDGVTISFYMKSTTPLYGSPKWFNDLFRVTGRASGGAPNVYAQVTYDTGQTYSVTHDEWMYVQISYKWDGSNFVDYTFYIIDENGDQEVKVVKSDVTTNNGLQSSNKFWETNNKWFNMEVATFRGDINLDFYLTNFRFENKYRSESYWKGLPPSTTGSGFPSLTHDGYNKLSIENITPTASTLRLGSNTYDIGTATDIYIEDTGTYEIETKDANTFALASNVVSSVTRVEPALVGGNAHLHALSYDGKLYAWGINDDGELGLGDNTNKTTPTLYSGPLVSKILNKGWSGGNTRNETSWIKTVGNDIYATGKGDTYMIPGTTSDLLSFTDVTSYFGDQSLTSNNIVFVGGGERSCVALTESGNVWTWGTHDTGFWNLGQGTGASSSNTPKQITFGGVTDNISRVAFGHDHAIALDTDGDVWFWGQIWNGTVKFPQATLSDAQKSPHEIMTSNNIVGVSSTFFTIYAWQSDGTYYALGQDEYGQIGDGTATVNNYTSWQKIEYFSANNITINEIYTGQYNVFADTSDGWYCWGNGSNGAFGNGGTGNLASPTKWTNVSNIKLFSAGGSYMGAAITEDGKYYAWGHGSQTQRGDNSTSAISYPKYIDTLPNILAPSFEFDGYDKVLVNRLYEIQIWCVLAQVKSFSTLDGLEFTGITPTRIYIPYQNSWYTISSSGMNVIWRANGTEDGYPLNTNEHVATIYVNENISNFTDLRIKYITAADAQNRLLGLKFIINGGTILEETTKQTIDSNYKTSYSFTPSTFSSITKYTKDTHTYDTNQAQIITVSDPGTYDAQLSQYNSFTLTSETIPATKTTGLYTWAFHHGNFDNAYGDGDILTARDNGRFYADTPSYTGDIGTITTVSSTTSNTTYTFTPASTLTANVLMVAGGGGGGGRYSGGGGGAGGLVYTSGTSLAQSSTKTIVVGNGDSGGNGNGQNGYNGKDTTFTGLDTAIGGGYGGKQGTAGGTGGSGGGSGGATSNGNDIGGYGTSGQGNSGGTGSSTTGGSGAGGGGSGSAGIDGTSTVGGSGGNGKFFGTGSSYTDFGDEYGEGGYFAGGGGGGTRSSAANTPGTPGRGGGGYGATYYGYMGINDSSYGGSQHALPHTGGGGGGSGVPDRDQHPGYASINDGGVLGHGGRGGSGIVLIQTNITLPNGANTAVVQVGNPRRRSLPPAVSGMGSEVNRFYIIDSASMPTYKLPTHWYIDPIGSNSNSLYTTEGSHSLQKRADGGISNVWYATSNHYFAEYGSYMAQTADAVFMPVVKQQSYDILLSIGSNGSDDISFEMNADGTASLRRNVYTTSQVEIAGGTIVCFEAGKWHHIALTVDSGGNAVGYVNGYPVVSGTYTSVAAVGSRSGNMHFRCGVSDVTFRKFLTYEVNTYNFHMSPKQVMQRAAEVGLGPKLEYDGLNTINVVNIEKDSEITIYESNVNDTSNLYVVSCNESSYLLSNAGTYYAQIKGTDTFTITRPLTVTDDHFPLYQYPPVATGTLSNGTFSIAAGSGNQSYFTVSGAETGNGTYSSYSSVAAASPGSIPADSSGVFTNIINASTITYTNEHYNFFLTTTTSNVDLVVTLPSAKTIRKYVLYPTDTNAPTSPYEPGSSVNPILEGNTNEDNLTRPKSWVLYGYTQNTGWVSLDTVTNQPPSIYGDVHSISSPASYDQYKLSISENNGSTTHLQLGEWQLWGDA